MRAVFLDRDGVLNKTILRDRKPYPPSDLSKVEILSGVKLALKNLRTKRFKLIVITNQPDVARGKTTIDAVEKINRFLEQRLPIDDFYCCFHDDSDDCFCRKPREGAILRAAKAHNIDLKNSYMVGDRWKDIEAGERAGCKTIFLDYDYHERRPNNYTYRVVSLLEASKIILGEKHDKSR